MELDERMRNQMEWMNGTVKVMVATNAFGLGINKPNTRFVFHIRPPKSLELIANSATVGIRKEEIKKVKFFCENTNTCKRLQLLGHFDNPTVLNMLDIDTFEDADQPDVIDFLDNDHNSSQVSKRFRENSGADSSGQQTFQEFGEANNNTIL